jgi:hypothetical protein
MRYNRCIIFGLLYSIDISCGVQHFRGSGGFRATSKRVSKVDGLQTQIDIREREQRSRETWEFEQDDIFMQYVTAPPTVTDRPSTSPGM